MAEGNNGEYQTNLASYESKLISSVRVVEQRCIMRVANPLATKKSVFTVFRAIAVLFQQPEKDMAIQWNL